MSSLLYFFRESLTGFKRNLSTALGSIITIFLSLLIIGIFCICGVIINNVVTSVENQVSITAYVADDASEQDIHAVEQYIQELPGVESVDFTTKDQALENFTNSMTSNPDIVAQLDGENPLPASIDVNLSEAQSVSDIANRILENETFVKICDNPDDPSDSLQYGQKTVDKLFSLTNAIRYIGIGLIVVLVLIAFIFINNTIRLAILARRKEVAIHAFGWCIEWLHPWTVPGRRCFACDHRRIACYRGHRAYSSLCPSAHYCSASVASDQC